MQKKLNKLLLITYLELCFLLLLSTSCDQAKTKAESMSEQKPNVIFILADDAGYGDFSCYGQTRFETPNIDRLAKNGLRFTSHYSGSTVCAPSRSVLLTGLHTGHTPIRGNKEIQPEGQHPLPDSIFSMVRLFENAGYNTGIFGKWGLGFPGSEGDPLNQGVDTFYGFNCQRMSHHYYPHYLWDNDQIDSLTANSGTKKGEFAPSVIHSKVLEFIDQNKEEPFFLYLPTIIPHAELAAPEEYMSLFRNKFGSETPFEGIDDGPDFRKGPYQSQTEPKAAFAAMMTLLDDQIGEIAEKIDDLGLSDNTLIIITSDNGPHLEAGADPDFFDSNGPYKGYKRDLYEGGIRVPLITYWPKNIKPGVTDYSSAFWDWLPTMSDLLGQEMPVYTDGLSLLPTLLGRGEQQMHDYLYWEFHEKGGRQAVRKGSFKGIRYDVLEKPDSPLELYNLTEDPGEEINLAEEYPLIVQNLQQLMQEARFSSDVFRFSLPTYLDDGNE